MKTKFYSKDYGLTLVEVLVVIVCIAIIVVLILPAFVKAKIRGGNSCINNLKQISLGFNLFANDNNGKFPWQLTPADGDTMGLAVQKT